MGAETHVCSHSQQVVNLSVTAMSVGLQSPYFQVERQAGALHAVPGLELSPIGREGQVCIPER